MSGLWFEAIIAGMVLYGGSVVLDCDYCVSLDQETESRTTEEQTRTRKPQAIRPSQTEPLAVDQVFRHNSIWRVF